MHPLFVNRRLVAALSALALGASVRAALAAEPTAPPYAPPPYVAPTQDPSIVGYNDRSIDFVAPRGWRRVDLQAEPNDSGTPLVAFVEPTTVDPVAITITITPFEGTLERFEIDKEQDIRQANGFVESHVKETMPNGMPANFFVYQTGDNTTAVRHFEWLVIDGRRSIVVDASSRLGVLSKEAARRDLANLSVVLYPKGRDPGN